MNAVGIDVSKGKSTVAITCILLAFLLLFIGVRILDQLEQAEGYYIPHHELGEYEIANEQNSEWIPNSAYIRGTERRIYETIFDVLPGGQSIQLSGVAGVSERNMVMLFASLGWIIISSSCGVVIFQKRDLK